MCPSCASRNPVFFVPPLHPACCGGRPLDGQGRGELLHSAKMLLQVEKSPRNLLNLYPKSKSTSSKVPIGGGVDSTPSDCPDPLPEESLTAEEKSPKSLSGGPP